MKDRVRVGVVGTGGWARSLHLPALTSHPRAEVVALCGRNQAHAESVAQQYAIPRVFTDYRTMIEQADLQAIVVVTPDALHYPMTMDALDVGLHVLCEKPLALTASQAKAMYDKAEAVGVKHMVLFTSRWLPPYRYIRQLIDTGYLGRCYHCQLQYVGEYGRRPDYAWRFDQHQSTGILGDLGAHLIDLAHWYVGDIARVSAHLATFVDRPGPDGQLLAAANDTATVLLEFVNGAQGLIHVTAVAHVRGRGQDQHIALYGEGATMELDLVDGRINLQGSRQDEEHFHTLDVPDELWGGVDLTQGFIRRVNEYVVTEPVADRAFIDAIIADQPVAPNFYDGYKVQQVIDAALASHAHGCWIPVA
ncbi:MAG: Gfo/Idh/MocA family oxidoreductase [Herpetosiphonaceae bacterium]|nr:Gfo/Idh/MocA family oxidoreductase [Herpetosiphonaceae bacterium]